MHATPWELASQGSTGNGASMKMSLYLQDSQEWGVDMATACNLSPSEIHTGISKL